MTSLYFDPALLEGPSDPEPREQLIVNGRYYLPPLDDPTGKRRSLQRVTNFIKQLSEQGGLTTWKLRSAVIGLARDERRYDLACSINPDSPRGKQELDQLIEECIDFANAGPSGGNITGTALHNYTDDVAGSYPIRVRDKWVPKLENYFTALHNKGLRVVPGLQERLVVSERYGTCGRLDDVYEDPFGTLRVGDRKSQKEFQTWWEVGAQLALYQSSDAMWNEAECRWEDMPVLADDFCHVAWMPLRHPAAKKGGDVDTVTIYDIPLAGPREVLEWCLRVRTLRTQARQWGQERPDLDAFAVTARDIRDAETYDDLRKIAANRTAGNWSDELHQPMAARRWEELVAAPKPEPVSVSIEDAAFVAGVDHGVSNPVPVIIGGSTVPHSPIQVAKNQVQWAAEREATRPPTSHPVAQRSVDDAVYVRVESGTQFDADRTALTVTGTHDAVAKLALSAEHVRDMTPGDVAQALGNFECRFDGKRVDEHPIHTPDFHCISPEPRPHGQASPLSQEEIERRRADVFERLRQSGEKAKAINDVQNFAFTSTPRVDQDVTGLSRHAMERLSLLQDVITFDPALGFIAFDPALFVSPEQEEATFLDPETFGGRTVDEVPGPQRPAETVGVTTEWQAHPVATAQFTHSQHENATVVELPDAPASEDSSPGWDPVKLQPTLDSVSVKILKEVCTRAGNSKSSRGRVRLLNDLEKKYGKYQEALLPALLREWLVIDGLNGEPGFSKDGVPRVANTGGSNREPMDARLAGRISLTDYLATKEAPKSVTAETEVAPAPVPDRDAAEPSDERAQRREAAGQGEWMLTPEQVQTFADEVAEIRKPYQGLTEGPQAGKHSILRLIELAKDAASSAERGKVFEAISRYHTWTGEIAAEINQHYLDAGQSTVDFDPYFAAQQDAEMTATEEPGLQPYATLPLDPDDPTTVQDALHLLGGVESRDQLTLMWSQLATKPYFQDQALQEGLLAKMMNLKK